MDVNERAGAAGCCREQQRVCTATGAHSLYAPHSIKHEPPSFRQRPQETAGDRLCLQVPDGVSPFEAAASAIRPLDEYPTQYSPTVPARFGIRDEAGSDASLQQMFDAQVPDITDDSRRGSPLQQAARELFRPSPSFEAQRMASAGSGGLQSSISQTLAEQLLPNAPLQVPPVQDSSSYSPQDEFGSSDGMSATMPAQGNCEVDFINMMMEQAHRVGLWRDPQPEGRAPSWSPSSGQPILPETLLSQAASGVDEKHFADANPLAVYESGIASLLPDKSRPRKPWAAPAAFEGVGIIDREILNNEARTSSLPRLQPVSLDIPHTSIQAAFAGSHQQVSLGNRQKPPNGPYRPATTMPRVAVPGKGGEGEMMHPMLQQSKLQLSLGLAADKPLDLKSWGYGSTSAATQGCSATSERTDARQCADSIARPLGRTSTMPAKLPTALLSLRPAISDSTTHQSICNSPSAGHNASSAATFQMPSISAGLVKDGQTDRKAPSTSMSHEDGSSRLESLERYREKKRRRLFSKTIRYHKRKVNADKRPRIKGRFVKASESSAQGDDDMSASEGHEEDL